MRIALDVGATTGQKTGIGVYADCLLRALRRVAPGHEFVAVGESQAHGGRTDQRLLWQQVRLPLRARAADADLLHVPGFDAPRWAACPVVLTVHDLFGMVAPRSLPPVSRWYWQRWLPHSIRWASRILTDSDHTRRELLRLLDIAPARIDVVPLGVEARFRPLDDAGALQAVRAKYGLPPRFVLYLGTLEPRKGLGALVSAFAALAADRDHGLVLAGKRGWFMERLDAAVQTALLGGRVFFPGYVPDEDVPALMNLAELFVFPSTYEGFGLPPLEALACGVPVVTTTAASLPEVVGDAALLVPPGNAPALTEAMRRLLDDAALRRELRARGLQRASRFTWDETARRTVAVYEEVVP